MSITALQPFAGQPMRALDNSALIGEWGDHMAAQGLSERTQEMYVYAVHRLLSRSHTRGRNLLELTETDIVTHLAALGDKAHSKRQHRQAIRSLYRWCLRRRYRHDDPSAILDGAKRPRRTRPEPFTQDELVRLLIAAAVRDPRRAWAILACYALGTRRSELCGIRPEDIRWNDMTVHLPVTKNDQPRTLPMGPLAAEALQELANLYSSNPYGTLVGVAPQQFGAWVNQAARDCGFPPGRKRRAHTLRASFASHLGHKGVPPEVIRDLLGHENISTTSVYLGTYEGDGERAVALLDGSPR